MKKIVKKAVVWHSFSLPGKYGKLIEEVMPGSREEQRTLVGTEM